MNRPKLQLPVWLRPFMPIVIGVFAVLVLVSVFGSAVLDHEASKGTVAIQQTPTVVERFPNFEIAKFKSSYFELMTEKIGELLGSVEPTTEGQTYEFTVAGVSFPARVLGTSAGDKDHIQYQVANAAPLDPQLCPGGVSVVYAIVSHPAGASVQLLAGLENLPVENAVGFNNPAQTVLLTTVPTQTISGYDVSVDVLRLDIPSDFHGMVSDIYVYSPQPGLVLWGMSLEHSCQVGVADYHLYSPTSNVQDGLENRLSVYGFPNVAAGDYQLVGNIPFQITNYDLGKHGAGVPSNVSEIWVLMAWPTGTVPVIVYSEDRAVPLTQEILFENAIDSHITVGVVHLMNLSSATQKSYLVEGTLRLFGITVRLTD